MLYVLIFGWFLLISYVFMLLFIGGTRWDLVVVPPRFVLYSAFRQFPEGKAKGSFSGHFWGFDRCMEGHEFLHAFLTWSQIIVFIVMSISTGLFIFSVRSRLYDLILFGFLLLFSLEILAMLGQMISFSCRHHLSKLKLVLTFLYPVKPDVRNFLFGEATWYHHVEYYGVFYQVTDLDEKYFRVFWLQFLQHGELIDRLLLANRTLKRKDALQLLKSNDKLTKKFRLLAEDLKEQATKDLDVVKKLQKNDQLTRRKTGKILSTAYAAQFKNLREAKNE